MKDTIGAYSFELFGKRGFIEGFSALVDFSDIMSRYATSTTEKEADMKAIKSDWNAVGADLYQAIKIHEQGGRNFQLAGKQ